MSDSPVQAPFSWRWVGTVALVLALTFWGSVEVLRHLFPRPHPQSYRSATWQMLAPETEGIVVGSSHVAFGFDPAPYDWRVLPLAAGAMDYACAEPVVMRAFDRAPNLKLIVIEADINGLLIDAIERARGDFYQLYALGVRIDDLPRGFYWKWRQRVLESHLLYPVFFLRRLTPRALFWEDGLALARQREAGDAMLKGFVPTEDVISARNDGRIVIEYHKAEFRRDHSAVNRAALVRIIERARARGIRVVLIRFPKHHSYRTHRPPEWETKYAEAMDWVAGRAPRDSYDVWDYDALDFSDTEYMDAHHLNRFGAARLAGLLKPRIDALLARPDTP